MFSNRMVARAKGFARSFALFCAVCAVALPAAVAPVRSRADGETTRVFTAGPLHIYVYNAQNQPVDVTSTHYIGADGYDYVTLDCNTFPVVINHQEGHVYNLAGGLIGYLAS